MREDRCINFIIPFHLACRPVLTLIARPDICYNICQDERAHSFLAQAV